MDNSMPTTHSDIDESKVTEQTEKSSPSSTLGGYYVPPLPGTGVDKCNVFVKFLPNEVTDTGLYAMFSKFGEITSYKVMVDPFSGSSLGYGFKSPDDAAQAIAEMSGANIGNKVLLCKLSHGISKNNANPNNNLYIKPLLPTTTEKDLVDLFSEFGQVIGSKVMVDRNTGLSRQIGFVRFADVECATKALAATNGRILEEGHPPIVVKYAENEPHRRNRKAKLIANQSAAVARKVLEQYKQHRRMRYSYPEPDYPPSEEYGNASIPYVVKDSFGNVTFAPTTPEPMNSYEWYPYEGYAPTYPHMYDPYEYVGNWYQPTRKFNKRKGKGKGFKRQRHKELKPDHLFIFHIPHYFTEEDLHALFDEFGEIDLIEVARDRVTQKSKGYAFIKYVYVESAVIAMQAMNGYKLGHKTLQVTLKILRHPEAKKDEDDKSSDEEVAQESESSSEEEVEESEEEEQDKLTNQMSELTLESRE